MFGRLISPPGRGMEKSAHAPSEAWAMRVLPTSIKRWTPPRNSKSTSETTWPSTLTAFWPMSRRASPLDLRRWALFFLDNLTFRQFWKQRNVEGKGSW